MINKQIVFSKKTSNLRPISWKIRALPFTFLIDRQVTFFLASFAFKKSGPLMSILSVNHNQV